VVTTEALGSVNIGILALMLVIAEVAFFLLLDIIFVSCHVARIANRKLGRKII
jgi:sterol desaturase/sphingolipid hydroxylase (fatty acid hydroxylase superfamily)